MSNSIRDGRSHRPFAMVYRDHVASPEVRGLSGATFRVWVTLLTFVGVGASWNVRRDTLARTCGVNVRTARRAVQELVTVGLVRVEYRQTVKGRDLCNCYVLCDPPSMAQEGGSGGPPQGGQGTPPEGGSGDPGHGGGPATLHSDHTDPSSFLTPPSPLTGDPTVLMGVACDLAVKNVRETCHVADWSDYQGEWSREWDRLSTHNFAISRNLATSLCRFEGIKRKRTVVKVQNWILGCWPQITDLVGAKLRQAAAVEVREYSGVRKLLAELENQQVG